MPTFVVIAHQHPDQVARLIRRLQPYPVIVHVSARVEARPFVEAATDLANATFLPDDQRVKVTWAGFSMVRALQHLLREATQITAPDDHVVVLSGACYPLHPVEQFAEHLRDAPFRQHLKYYDIASSDEHQRQIVDRRHYRDVVVFPRAMRGSLLAQANEATKRSLSLAMRWRPPPACPAGMRPMRGTVWCAITSSFASAALERSTPEFDRWVSLTFCPDEQYLHTLLEASPFSAETEAGGPVPYPGRRWSALGSIHLIDDSLDKFFTLADRPVIEQSDQWFVRKVAPAPSGTLLDWLDTRAAAPHPA